MSDIDAKVRGVFDDAHARYMKAEQSYGALDIGTDPRDFLKEAEEELLDLINYAAFEIMKIRALNERLNAFASAQLASSEALGGNLCVPKHNEPIEEPIL